MCKTQFLRAGLDEQWLRAAERRSTWLQGEEQTSETRVKPGLPLENNWRDSWNDVIATASICLLWEWSWKDGRNFWGKTSMWLTVYGPLIVVDTGSNTQRQDQGRNSDVDTKLLFRKTLSPFINCSELGNWSFEKTL